MASAFGNTILFVEPFVVYGMAAIASAVENKTTVTAEKANGEKGKEIEIATEEKGHNIEFLANLAKCIKGELGIEENIKLKLSTTIPIGSGMGSSAAFCVATVRALAEFSGKKLGNEEVNEFAYEGEKICHGTPSGIDNTIATFGGLVWFKKNLEDSSKNEIEKLEIKKPIDVVMGYTPRNQTTKEIVAEVRQRKEADEKKFGEIFCKAAGIVKEAKEALLSYDLEKIGKLMNENHKLLQEIGVSSKELNEMCEVALKEGALGAKLTGAGKGGGMIALTPNNQEKVAKAIEKLGYTVYRTKIGVN